MVQGRPAPLRPPYCPALLQACTSAAELAEVHALLRQRRAAAAGCPASSAALSWAPVDFKLLPLDGEDVERCS